MIEAGENYFMMLRALAGAVDARVILETGAGPGASGRAFCEAMRWNGHLVSVDVDANCGAALIRKETQNETGCQWDLITADSARVPLESLPASVDLLYIDGDHGRGAAIDFDRFWPLVRVGGLVVFDDYPIADGVRAVIDHAQTQLGLTGLRLIYNHQDGNSHYVFQRKEINA